MISLHGVSGVNVVARVALQPHRPEVEHAMIQPMTKPMWSIPNALSLILLESHTQIWFTNCFINKRDVKMWPNIAQEMEIILNGNHGVHVVRNVVMTFKPAFDFASILHQPLEGRIALGTT